MRSRLLGFTGATSGYDCLKMNALRVWVKGTQKEVKSQETKALSACAKKSRANPHAGGTEFDCRLEIARHAHGELFHAAFLGEL